MTRKLTNEEFLERLSSVNPDVIPLEVYKGGERKIKVSYKTCEHTEYKTGKKLLQGQQCGHKECQGQRISETKIKNAEKRNVNKLKKLGIVLLEDYKGTIEKTKVLNTKCKHTYEVQLGNVLSGSGCPLCHGMKDTQLFIKQVKAKHQDQYTVLGEYVNNKTKIEVIHNECGHRWNVSPKDLLREERCPNCITSKGERYVKRYLESNGLRFEQQYRFDDCRNINPLPFDFAVFVNEEVRLIEFDGSQHFGDSRYWGDGRDGFEEVKARDEIKNNYCNDNNIPLLRIPYWWIRNDRADRELNEFLSDVNLFDFAV